MGQSFLGLVRHILGALSPRDWIIAVLVGAVGLSMISTAVAHREAREAQKEVRAAGLALENAVASADYTRQVADSYRRRIEQLDIETDSLARALDERPVIRVPVEINAPPVTDTLIVAAESPDSVVFTYADTLLDVNVRTHLTPVVRGELTYDLQPISLQFDVLCGPAGEYGIRPVITQVTPSPRIATTIERGRVLPELCNPPLADNAPSLWDKSKWALGGGIFALIVSVLAR